MTATRRPSSFRPALEPIRSTETETSSPAGVVSPPRPARQHRQHRPAGRGRQPRTRTERRPIATLTRNTQPMPDIRRRLVSIVVLVVLVAGFLVWRLVQLQVVEPDQYVAWGEGQRIDTIALPGSRGDILDRNGEQLAVSLPQRSFFADPAEVVNPTGIAEVLAPMLRLDVIDVYDRLTADSRFSYLARQVPDSLADEIEDLNLPGVYAMDEPTRFNPAGDQLAASLIGSVNIDNDGLTGLELVHDELLRGIPGQMIVERDELGNTIPQGQLELKPAHAGSDVVLTIDRALQFEVERILTETVLDKKANGGVIVVSEPRTGEILAMASATMVDGKPAVSQNNWASTWTFDPGSIMKAITFAGVLDAGIAEPDTKTLVPDRIGIYDAVFSDHDPHPDVEWTVSDIVTQSSNVGTVMWAEELGADRFEAELRDFGFGQNPGLGLPGETRGLMIERDDYSGTTLAANALGQGISVTAIQMINAFNVIANDGVYNAPTLVRDVISPDGSHETPAREETRRVISQSTARKMRSILRNVVEAGTGTNAAIDGYDVAGKTGTARKAQEGGGYLDADGYFHYVSSFAGFLPASNPSLSILVAIDEPTTTYYASEAAAPAFAEVARYALRHFQIPPTVDFLVPSPATQRVPTASPAGSERARGVVATLPGEEPDIAATEDAPPIAPVAVEAAEPVVDESVPAASSAPAAEAPAESPTTEQDLAPVALDDAAPSDAAPTDAVPTDAVPTDVVPLPDDSAVEADPDVEPVDQPLPVTPAAEVPVEPIPAETLADTETIDADSTPQIEPVATAETYGFDPDQGLPNG